MKTSILAIFLLLITITSLGQSPYEFNKKQEISIVGLGAVSFGVGLYFRGETPLFTEQEIQQLDYTTINNFDQETVFNKSDRAQTQSDICLFGSVGVPLLFLIPPQTRTGKEAATIAALWGEASLLNAGLTILSKYTIRRARPFVYNANFSLADKQTTNAKASFFSGHASVVALNTFFAAKVFSDYFPNSPWKPVVWALGAGIPALTGYLRVAAGKHFPTDVITGYLVGAACGYFIPAIHKKKKDAKMQSLNIYTGINQLTLHYQF